MDGLLKALIGAACAVIIAGGAYFAWGEWQRAEEAAAAKAEFERQAIETVKREAERVRRAADMAAEQQKRAEKRRAAAGPTLERNHCHQQLTNLRIAVRNKTEFVEFYRDEVRGCIAASHLTESSAAGLMQ